MILAMREKDLVVVKDLVGEELYQFIKDRSTKKGEITDPFFTYKAMTLEVGAADDETIPFTLSTPDVDRYGDVVEQDFILDFYKANPVILWAHNHSIPSIGYMKEIGVDKNLRGRVRFNPAEIDAFGAGIEKRVRFGSIRAESIGFMPWEVEPIEEKSGTHTIITGFKLSKNELHECSICNVPANPFALTDFSPSGKKSFELKVNESQLPPAKAGFKMFLGGSTK
jgi:hypothetical protein